MRKAGVAAAVAAMTCVLAGEAQATTVDWNASGPSKFFSGSVLVHAKGDAGEQNNPQTRNIANPLGALRPPLALALRLLGKLGVPPTAEALLSSPRWLEITDPGNTVRAGSGGPPGLCVTAIGRVFCGVPEETVHVSVRYSLGDGNDSFVQTTGTEVPEKIAGGTGDDTLRSFGSRNGALLDGGPGNDRLDASGAADSTLVGDDGDDVLIGSPVDDRLFGGIGADDVSGGAGVDTHYYWHAPMPWNSSAWEDASTGVVVDLDGAADDGQPGEQDNLRDDIENLLGSQFDDVLTGSAAPNFMNGVRGNDRVDGGPGDDRLLGSNGDDVVIGGAGRDQVHGAHTSPGSFTDPTDDDELHVDDGEADTYSCSGGDDVVTADALDVFRYPIVPSAPDDCEVVNVV